MKRLTAPNPVKFQDIDAGTAFTIREATNCYYLKVHGNGFAVPDGRVANTVCLTRHKCFATDPATEVSPLPPGSTFATE